MPVGWMHSGVRIDIDSGGTFVAKVEDVDIREATLDAAKKAIDAAGAKKPKIRLPIVGALRKSRGYWEEGNDEPARLHLDAITGVNRTSRDLTFEAVPPGYALSDPIADTPQNRALMESWIEAMNLYTSRRAVIHGLRIGYELGHGRVDINRYAELLEKVQEQYVCSSHGGANES